VVVTVKQETVDLNYPKMCGDQECSAPILHSFSTGLTNVYAAEKYDVAYSHFDIHKVLLSCYFYCIIQGGSNMTGTDLYVNKPHCAAAVRP